MQNRVCPQDGDTELKKKKALRNLTDRHSAVWFLAQRSVKKAIGTVAKSRVSI